MRYYAKFHCGTQTKNKAQEAAFAFGKPADGTLIGSDAALDKFVENLKDGIDTINKSDKYRCCSDIDFRTHKFANFKDYSVNVGEIFSISFYPVNQDFCIDEPVDDIPEVKLVTVFKF